MKSLITNFSRFEEQIAIDASNVTSDYSPGEGHRMAEKTKEETLKLKIKNLSDDEVINIVSDLQPKVKASVEDSREWLNRFFISQLKQRKTELINKYFTEVTDLLNEINL